MILIEKPKIEDVRQIQDVFYITWLDAYPNDEIGITKEDVEERFKNRHSEEVMQKRRNVISNTDEKKLFLVAKDSEKVVGVCKLLKEDNFNDLEAIYVLPEYQGRGIGRMFWEEALKFWNLENNIIVRVATYNINAIKFYKKLGFVDSGKRFSKEHFKMPISGVCIPEMELIIKKK